MLKLNQFLGGLGNLIPNAFSILTIIFPGGLARPAYHALRSALGTSIIFANCYWFKPF